ncbi:MAG: class I SAM-dependent methyltransferase, partial [Pseudomonadota bacterium]
PLRFWGIHVDKQSYFEANRKSWDERVAIHCRDDTKFYDVEKIIAGKDSLSPIEAAEIGDVKDLRIAHLQCHFGLDSISLARRGASVTGLDFSSAAITEARALAEGLGVDAQFVEGNVYDARALLSGDFDRVYVTWGAINWLPDIALWAKIVASLLKPGGKLYLAETHQTILSFDWVEERIAPRYDWRTPAAAPIVEEVATTYTGAAEELSNKTTYSWQHPLSDIINGLIGAGLTLDWFREHAALVWPLFPNMKAGEDGLYRLPADHVQLPLAFSLEARKS